MSVTPQASPDPATSPWVPIWNLAPTIALDYLGQWAAGTYIDGQVVIDNGVAYMCVRQTTKRPSPWAPSNTLSNYGTTLPATPYDGQEAVLVDSLTAPTYTWRFRYNAGSSNAYKWEFIGGGELYAQTVAGQVVGTATTWTAITPQLPALVRAGDYNFSYSAEFGNVGTDIQQVYLTFGDASGPDDGARSSAYIQTPSEYRTVGRGNVTRNYSAGAAIRLWAFVTKASTPLNKTMLSMRPVRVS